MKKGFICNSGVFFRSLSVLLLAFCLMLSGCVTNPKEAEPEPQEILEPELPEQTEEPEEIQPEETEAPQDIQNEVTEETEQSEVQEEEITEEEEEYPEDIIFLEPVPVPEPVSRNLTDKPVKSAEQLHAFFMENNPEADSEMIAYMSSLYIQEALMEGINSDCAWVQMCLETGFLRFGGLVTPDMHNYCGLGAIDAEHPGEVFETEQLGVRAHIQHLHAYSTKDDAVLANECIDRRYKYVNPRGKAPDIFRLAGTWAADKKYGEKLDALLSRLEKF